MPIITNPDHFRKNVRLELHKKIYQTDTLPENDIIYIISSNLEKGIYNYTIKEGNSSEDDQKMV